jgi:hypothetical protein
MAAAAATRKRSALLVGRKDSVSIGFDHMTNFAPLYICTFDNPQVAFLQLIDEGGPNRLNFRET